jgi:hypothetical protein
MTPTIKMIGHKNSTAAYCLAENSSLGVAMLQPINKYSKMFVSMSMSFMFYKLPFHDAKAAFALLVSMNRSMACLAYDLKSFKFST